MPRIPSSVIVQAYREHPLLPLLLKECRSLDSARNELRWLRDQAVHNHQLSSNGPETDSQGEVRLKSMCEMRSRGFPLQYILGDQPFGDLEILCRRGVLIPRPETEAYTFQAARLVRQSILGCGREESDSRPRGTNSLHVLDLCTGTGCIALLLHALLAPYFRRVRVMGVDLSATALKLARDNLEHNLRRGLLDPQASADVHFHVADVLGRGENSIRTVEEVLSHQWPDFKRLGHASSQGGYGCDLLISNPPYISPSAFRDGTTTRSVRRFEPTLALVPPAVPPTPSGSCRHEDMFYRHIIALSLRLRTRLTVLECGDLMQAQRVVAAYRAMVSGHSGDFRVEIWPSLERDLQENRFPVHGGTRCVIIQTFPEASFE